MLFRNHKNLEGHKRVVEIHMMRQSVGISSELTSTLDAKERPDYIITNKHVRNVIYMSKRYLSFNSYEELVILEEANDQEVGQYCR